MTLRAIFTGLLLTLISILPAQAATEHYKFDIKGQHAFIQFKVKHLGFSWLLGEFRTFDGSFDYDADHPEKNRVHVTINTNSLDSNHAERNKHLRGPMFFDAEKYPTATFVSTSYQDLGRGKGIVKGTFTLRGITKKLAINITQIGTGPDPWGGYRRGFEGHTTLHLSDYNMQKAAMLGPLAENVEIYLSIEGLRQ